MKRQSGIYAIEFVCVCIFGVCGFFFVSIKGALLILLLGLILIAFHAIDIALRQKKLTSLNDYLNRILSGEESIREVIAFPMNSKAQDLLMGAPSVVTKKQLDEVHIKVDIKEK